MKAEVPSAVPEEIKDTQPPGTVAVPASPEEGLQLPTPVGSYS